MITIRENPKPKKINIEGKEVIIGPEYVMRVAHLRKDFKISAEEGNFYQCESQMTFKQACTLSPLKIPFNLSISFDIDKKILGVYGIYMISKRNKVVKVSYCFLPEDLLNGTSFRWSLVAYTQALRKEVDGIDIKMKEYGMRRGNFGEAGLELEIRSPILPKLADCITYTNAKLLKVHKAALISLANVQWRIKYEKDEKAFCLEILEPLFRKMGFRSIVYNHGTKEFGKDFTFSEIDKFDQVRHYGVQVKAGNISGEIASKIDKIIGQIEDAFRMPYFSLNPKNPNYVTTVLVIISGRFKYNAKEKIRHKLDRNLYGSVYFMDKQEVVELIEKYWAS